MTTTSPQNTNASNPLASATFLVFAATILGYILAFAFQLGFLSYFGVSYRFIEITTHALIISIGATTIGLMTLDSVAGAYRELMTAFDPQKPTHRFAASFVRLAAIILAPALVLCLIWENRAQLILLISVLVYIYLALFMSVFPFLFNLWKKKKVAAAIEAMYEDKDAAYARAEQNKSETYVEKYSWLIGPIALIVLIAVAAGRQFAASQDGMYITHDKGRIKTVLILKANDTIFLKDFDTKNKKLLPGFTIDKIDGPLTLQQRVSIKPESK